MTRLLELHQLTAGYGKVAAVDGVSVTLDVGQIVSVIGPNGAGKTTMLNAMMGLLPSRGSLTLDGGRIDHLPVENRLEAGLTLVAEARELFPSMSVEDNLRLGGFSRRSDGKRALTNALDEIYERFPRLRERRAQLAGTLSGGERQMLAIGRALMARPRVLMLDEPSLGLAPLIVHDMFRIITELRSAQISVLLVEQNAKAALAISDFAYVLELGSVSLHGPSADLARDPRVIESYLGTAGGNPLLPAEGRTAGTIEGR